jgi:eukaryotic-like serine/threonine-protein kinase
VTAIRVLDTDVSDPVRSERTSTKNGHTSGGARSAAPYSARMEPTPEERDSSTLANVPIGTEAAREFLQKRLRLCAALVTSLSGAFYAINTVAFGIANPGRIVEHALYAGNVFHLIQIGLSAVVWLTLAQRKHGEPVLRAIDAIATIGSMTLLSAMVATELDQQAHLVAALCFLSVATSRGILVPSTAARTLAITSVGAVPLVALTAISSGPLHAVYVSTWCGIGIVLARVASKIIFGLTAKVREAYQLGQYTLLERLGGGGMGEVYRAQHAMLRRPTAIKLVRPGVVGEETLKRFEREVRLTARLAHPNTVAIYDYGRTPDGIFYYAMELLDGVDLQRLVDQHGPMPAERVVHVLDQVCGSLGEAHELGLIHRDVKPANIVLCTRARAHDVVKVLDFGLVKDLHASDEVAVSNANTIAGTPLYLAPETITAPETIDARTDLYAIGLVGWFLLTGRPVFLGKTVVEVCGHHLHTAPERPSEVGAKVDADLEAVIMRCLAKKPAERFRDADELRGALAATRAFGRWSEGRARDWWEERDESEPSAAQPRAETGILSIDFGARASEGR